MLRYIFLGCLWAAFQMYDLNLTDQQHLHLWVLFVLNAVTEFQGLGNL